MADTRFGFRDEEERIEFLIALPVLAFFGWMLYHYVFDESGTQGLGGTAVASTLNAVSVEADDFDGDGVPDLSDHCTSSAGSKANFGCPASVAQVEPGTTVKDSDGDGLTDSIDRCPKISGPVKNHGCLSGGTVETEETDVVAEVEAETVALLPVDSDGDAVPDTADQCPDEFGAAATNGCPEVLIPTVLDTDSDGVVDEFDQCPDQAGAIENRGCVVVEPEPEPVSEPEPVVDTQPAETEVALVADTKPADRDQNALDSISAEIRFESGSAVIVEESKLYLDEIATIMKKYPSVKLVVEGHTDNLGSPAGNRQLSEERALACTTYLESNGITSDRMQAIGLGDSRPLVPNTSEESRKRNRRVEFRLTN